uniref:F-box protein GID2 n=1 Tax=Kalanchoe fedtschenkoi TaxID=63787 RepID=A0A7N0UCC2_KALFE
MAPTKRARSSDEDPANRGTHPNRGVNEDVLFEILKRADARTLGAAACVSREWRRVARDERVWEAACARRWTEASVGCGEERLRSVVLALGGFRRLHALLAKSFRERKTSSFCGAKWGRDEVNLSLCLLSIKCYERIKVGGL